MAPLNMSAIVRPEEAVSGRVNIINCVSDDIKVELSKLTEIATEAAIRSLDAAVGDLKRGLIDVLVTAPAPPPTAGNNYLSHTEYLEKVFAGGKNKTLTVITDGAVRIALATGDIPFSEILPKITKENITEKLITFDKSLKEDVNIVRPRIAVLSLNPHTAEERVLAGDEEEGVILVPAMQEAEKQGVMSFGPYAADRFFGERMYDLFDGVLAMYYDQGATPFRTMISTGNSLYYTAGLPIVHTSPTHGTAYEIAGQNIAPEDSFRQSIYTAIDIFRNRQTHHEATRNPLRKQYFDKGAVDESIDLTKEDDADIL
jgi:4-hydroxythreonine-4-phosphate dehydrogenase